MLDIDSLLSDGNQLFYKFTNSDRKTWLIPKRNMATALELYQPSGLKGLILKDLFPLFHWVPLARKVIHASKHSYTLDQEILGVAKQSFGEENVEYSIFGGTPSVHQKITIQFFNGKKILGYGKITDNQEVEKLFVKEQAMLDYLRKQGITGIPKCLSVKRLANGMTIFLQTTEKRRKSFSPQKWSDLHYEFLDKFTAQTTVPVLFGESDYYYMLMELTRVLPSLPNEYKTVISRAINMVHNEFGMRSYEFSAYHGDFTPWNMFVNGNSLFVFDWEYGELTYPPMLDRYHFFVQQYIHVEHLSAGEIYNRIHGKEWYDPKIFRCYLLDIISRFVSREKGGMSGDLSRMLEIWTKLLIYL